MSSFAAPPATVRSDGEAMSERAGNTATSVLALAGIDAQPRSREHTLLTTLFGGAWTEGRDLDLPGLIQQVQSPPFEKIGVLDLEAFFPARDRFELATRLNGLLAAPGFSQWLEGGPLDPASLLRSSSGKPRVAILSIAHLGEAERMFVVSLVMNQLVAWMRTQTGTSSLRAMVYMDEILGYFPPVANPPSKAPLMTLLKQGRAFGLGVVLATQNPVDLDYKGLANTGTWFLGRLQTDRDKARMLDGLEGAAGGLDRAETDRLLSALGKRVFLLHDVHQKAPIVFQSRWALSYLRGPLSRDQIRQLMAGSEAGGQRPGAGDQRPEAGDQRPGAGGQRPEAGGQIPVAAASPPVLPPGIQQFFVPPSAASGTGAPVRYTPGVIGIARIGYADAKLGVDEVRDVVYVAPFQEGAIAIDWESASRVDVPAANLTTSAASGAVFGTVPAAGMQAKSYGGWSKDFGRWLAQAEKLELMSRKDLKLTSRPGETERDFNVRVQEAVRATRDAAVEALRKKYASKQAQLAEQRRRAEASVERESAQASQQKLQTTVSVGATILGALFGRKVVGAGTIGRATTAARGVSRSMKEADDIRRANESLEAVNARQQALEGEIEAETKRIASEYDAQAPIERVALTPKRGQISVQAVGLGWVPAP
jgi:hypothetical protein